MCKSKHSKEQINIHCLFSQYWHFLKFKNMKETTTKRSNNNETHQQQPKTNFLEGKKMKSCFFTFFVNYCSCFAATLIIHKVNKRFYYSGFNFLTPTCCMSWKGRRKATTQNQLKDTFSKRLREGFSYNDYKGMVVIPTSFCCSAFAELFLLLTPAASRFFLPTCPFAACFPKLS